jgi:hypothetical protein
VRGAVVAFVVAAAATAALEVVSAQRAQVDLVPFIGGAAVIAGAVALVVARRFWWLSALGAAVLVPVLDFAYQAARLLLCLVTDCHLD